MALLSPLIIFYDSIIIKFRKEEKMSMKSLREESVKKLNNNYIVHIKGYPLLIKEGSIGYDED